MKKASANIYARYLPALSGVAPLFIIGTAKNAGKTTLLNRLSEAYRALHDASPGLVSVGIDGEETDYLYGHSKPVVAVKKGDIVATTDNAVEKSSADFEIIERLARSTVLGAIVIAKCVRDGNVELIGPETNEDLKGIISLLREKGAKKIFIDGAFDRKTQIALEEKIDVAIAATPQKGETVERYIERVSKLVERYRLPQFGGKWLSPEPGIITFENRLNLPMVFETGELESLTEDKKQKLLNGNAINSAQIGGALTDSIAGHILDFNPKLIVVHDPSRIFLSVSTERMLNKRGIAIKSAISVHISVLALCSSWEKTVSLPPQKTLELAQNEIRDILIEDLLLV